MDDRIRTRKSEIRKGMKRLLREYLSGQDAETRSRTGEALASKVCALETWKEADYVCCFLSMPDEIETGPLIDRAMQEHKSVFVPRIEGDDISFVALDKGWRGWERDAWNIPVPPAHLEAVGPLFFLESRTLFLVPGLAFDGFNRRLGRGKGYYDRYIAGMDENVRASRQTEYRMPTLVGIGLVFQVVPEVPADEHDRILDSVITV